MDLYRKLAILADAAKYDASCASSGTSRRNSRGTAAIGSTTGSGICHSYTPDGRCVSLLKILFTNYCVYDCVFCVNRISSDTIFVTCPDADSSGIVGNDLREVVRLYAQACTAAPSPGKS